MKLFHLSDLHLGKRLKEISLIEDQEYILKKILTAAGSEKPDGILIAGDVYDRAVPSEEAMKLWDDFLVSLAEKKIPVFVVSGNHDSAIRLSDHSELVEAAGIHFSPVYDGTVKRIALEAGGEKVYIHMLPFVKPAIVKSFFPEEEINDYTDACRVALSKADVDSSVTNILMAHQFVTGAERCDSEEVVVGGLDNVNASVFDAFDYVALGHIHGKQHIGRETVRYCGTPLKYSFSEKDHHKSITVVNISGKEITLDEIPLNPLRDLREIRGTYDELTDKKNYENTNTEDYIHAVLKDENDILDAMGKLRSVYPNIMQITYDNARTKERNEIGGVENVETKSPLELFEELFKKQNNAPMSEEQKKFITECIESVWEG